MARWVSKKLSYLFCFLPQIPLERALRMNIIDADLGTIRDPATGRTLTIAEAVNQGIVIVEYSEPAPTSQAPIAPQVAGRSQTLPVTSGARKRSHVSAPF